MTTTSYLKKHLKGIVNDLLEHHRPVNNEMWSLQELCVARIEHGSSMDDMITYGCIPDAEYPDAATWRAYSVNSKYQPTLDDIWKLIRNEVDVSCLYHLEITNVPSLYVKEYITGRSITLYFYCTTVNYYRYRENVSSSSESDSDQQ